MFNIKVIKSDQEHEAAVARLSELMDAEPLEGSAEENELEVLTVLIEHYEREHFPMDKPDPIEAIKFRMDQLGLVQKDLVEFMGSASRVSEVLNGKRALSLNMIRRLYHGLDIPLDILIQAPDSSPGVQHHNKEILGQYT